MALTFQIEGQSLRLASPKVFELNCSYILDESLNSLAAQEGKSVVSRSLYIIPLAGALFMRKKGVMIPKNTEPGKSWNNIKHPKVIYRLLFYQEITGPGFNTPGSRELARKSLLARCPQILISKIQSVPSS